MFRLSIMIFFYFFFADYMPKLNIVKDTNVWFEIAQRDFNAKLYWIDIWQPMTHLYVNMNVPRVVIEQPISQIYIVTMRNIANKLKIYIYIYKFHITYTIYIDCTNNNDQKYE